MHTGGRTTQLAGAGNPGGERPLAEPVIITACTGSQSINNAPPRSPSGFPVLLIVDFDTDFDAGEGGSKIGSDAEMGKLKS